MSKLIRSTTVKSRPADQRSRKAPVWVIASGGEVFVMKRTRGAITWVPARESDFPARSRAGVAANEAVFNNVEQ